MDKQSDVSTTKKDDRTAVERAATPSPARAQGGPVDQPTGGKPFVSEGMRAELEMHGEARDANGRRVVGTGTGDARYEDAPSGVQASDVAGRVGAAKATNDRTK